MAKSAKLRGIAAVIGLLAGCGSAEKYPVRRDIFAMDTYMSLTAYGSSADKALDAAENELRELEKQLSVTDENSDISRINSDSSADVSDTTAELISAALEYCHQTDGALDVTIYPVLREWGFTCEEYKIPEKQAISELLERVDYSRVSVDGCRVTIPEGFMLDMGAAAKGYASDRLIGILSENGVKSAIISLGGNVKALGTRPDGSDWSVAIREPFAPDESMARLKIGEKAVVTSGSYERYFVGEDGKTYCHIIDPTTGCPVDNGLVSVTVVGDSGLMCDCLSTALFVMGEEKACDFWRNTGGFDMVLVNDDKQISYTAGLEDSLEILNGMTAEVIGND